MLTRKLLCPSERLRTLYPFQSVVWRKIFYAQYHQCLVSDLEQIIEIKIGIYVSYRRNVYGF